MALTPIPTGTDTQVNTYTSGDQIVPSVTALNDGGFVVTWSSDGQDGSGYGIYGQRYAADGTPVGSEFRVNQITSGNQYAETFYGSETLATLADGHLVQVWAGNGQEEVFFRLIDVPSANTAPTLAVANALTSLAEGSYANHVKVADITITDDGAGTNNLTLSGNDAALFEVFDGDLYLKAGTVLDFEGNPTLDVTVAVDDPAVAGSPDDTEALVVTVQDVAAETINGTSRADTLTGTIKADVINGLAGNDNLRGLGGNDTLDGGSGRDTMAGGTGNDIYVVDGITDVVSEKANEGVDTVQS